MSLIAELKRRKVFKVGVAYLVIGWLLIQVAATLAPLLNLPDWAPRLIALAIMLGFPLALLLAWIFEATPEGIRLDSGSIGNKRVIAACIILAALAVGWYWKTRPTPASSDADARSVAVLPFVNMSDDKGNDYFSDGISEEILNVLARVPELHVAARTSSFSFRKQEKIPQIARELNVRMVLEGSVRKQAERVRITAQLIDAANGYHLWSQTFDRELKDIFAIQDEIAAAIAQELKVKLVADHSGTAAPRATTDPETYDLYLKGISQWQARGEKNLLDAEATFRAVLARDPNYAKAWAGLALVYAVLSSWSDTLSDAASEVAARDAAEHASSLDPMLPEPWAALGNAAYSELRFDTARALFARSLAIAPSYATAQQWLGEALMTEGDVDAGLAAGRRAVALDPKSPVVRGSYAFNLFTAGHDTEALAECDTIIADAPDWYLCAPLQFDTALLRKDHARARAVLEKPAAARGAEAVNLLHAQMDALDGMGDVQAVALRLLELPDAQLSPRAPTPLNGSDAMYWFMAIGRNDLAVERFIRYERGAIYTARQLAYDPHYAVLHCDARFVDALRRLKVEEPHLSAPCPTSH